MNTVPTEVILADIRDTQEEINTMKREIEGLRILGDRMKEMLKDAPRVSGIDDPLGLAGVFSYHPKPGDTHTALLVNIEKLNSVEAEK